MFLPNRITISSGPRVHLSIYSAFQWLFQGHGRGLVHVRASDREDLHPRSLHRPSYFSPSFSVGISWRLGVNEGGLREDRGDGNNSRYESIDLISERGLAELYTR
jgi:hypothetical protein